MQMGAIAGYTDLPTCIQTEQMMLKTMQRRGPDGRGVMRCGACTLLSTRLALEDRQAGQQPLGCCWHGNQYTIVFSGSLFDTQPLRKDLEQAGHCLPTGADAELVLHSYLQWGKPCLNRFSGVYAFAIWDGQSLFLARDRLGIRPLFYMKLEGGLVFASEMKTVLAYPAAQARLDEQGIAELILLGPGRTPGCGVFRDMEEMKPGYYGIWKNGKLNLTCYWKLRDREHRQTLEETAEQVHDLVTNAVHQQMTRQAPMGAFLSGGLDSSVLSAIAGQDLRERGKRIQTFSVDYLHQEANFHPTRFQPDWDGHYIGLMQQFLQSEHRTVSLSPEQLEQTLEEAVCARDLPGMGDVDASLLLLCRSVRESVPAVLSGEGADEIFGGYPWFLEAMQTETFPWAKNTPQRLGLISPAFRRDWMEAYVRQKYRSSLSECDLLPEQPEEEKRIKQMTWLNMNWFMQTLADRNDRMSQFCGLEVRVPFCDHRIAQYLYGIPWAMKRQGNAEKGLLRLAMEGLVPEEVLWRKKSPYPKTFDPAYGRRMEQRMEQLLAQRHAPLFDLLDRAALEQFLRQKAPTPWYGQLMGRPQTIAYLLQLNFWLQQYRVQL